MANNSNNSTKNSQRVRWKDGDLNPQLTKELCDMLLPPGWTGDETLSTESPIGSTPSSGAGTKSTKSSSLLDPNSGLYLDPETHILTDTKTGETYQVRMGRDNMITFRDYLSRIQSIEDAKNLDDAIEAAGG